MCRRTRCIARATTASAIACSSRARMPPPDCTARKRPDAGLQVRRAEEGVRDAAALYGLRRPRPPHLGSVVVPAQAGTQHFRGGTGPPLSRGRRSSASLLDFYFGLAHELAPRLRLAPNERVELDGRGRDCDGEHLRRERIF